MNWPRSSAWIERQASNLKVEGSNPFGPIRLDKKEITINPFCSISNASEIMSGNDCLEYARTYLMNRYGRIPIYDDLDEMDRTVLREAIVRIRGREALDKQFYTTHIARAVSQRA